MDKRINRKLINILVSLLIIISIGRVVPIVKPVLEVFFMLVTPIIISFFIYYWLRPITRKLSSSKYSKFNSVVPAFVILIFLGILTWIVSSAGSVLVNQFKDVFINSDGMISNYKDIIQDQLSNLNISSDMAKKLASTLENAVGGIGNGIINMFSEIGDFTTQIVLIPFIVYYLLRDEKKGYNKLKSLVPEDKKERVISILSDMDEILSNYITGQLLVAFILGVLMFIGFIILKVPNALLMGTFVTITSVIPIIGAFLGILPAILTALTMDLILVVKIIVLAVLIQQVESNLITPNIMGSKLSIHPLTVMITVIISINLMGVFGAFIGVPVYLVLSTIIKDVYNHRKES